MKKLIFLWLIFPTGYLCGEPIRQCDSTATVCLYDHFAMPDGRRGDAIDSHIPLILIHGIHGVPNDKTVFDGDDDYWESFIRQFDLGAQFKPYRVVYLSDRVPISIIATRLRRLMEEARETGFLPETEAVWMAHSMGGLVVREYMRKEEKGVLGGSLVKKLITLATPHHGTLIANLLAREEYRTSNLWGEVFDRFDREYWSNRSGAAHLQNNSFLPNRSDLRWDFMIPPTKISDDGQEDVNSWLCDLNSDWRFDPKIIAYAGFYYDSLPGFAGFLKNPLEIFLNLFDTDPDEHHYLYVSGSVLANGFRGKEGWSTGFQFNDGLVVDSSARFDGHAVEVREFPGLDHLDMKESEKVFKQVKVDLQNIAGDSCVYFPSEIIPFTRIDYITNPNSAGDHLVVGYGPPNQFNDLIGRFVATTDNQKFCGYVQLAPDLFAKVYLYTDSELIGDFSNFKGLLAPPFDDYGYLSPDYFNSTFAWRVSKIFKLTVPTAPCRSAEP